MQHFIGAVSLCLGMAGTLAQAEDARLVVLELYTSQGCSSCPPADKLLGELSQENDDILALSFHVDYWDYIGWSDTFAAPKNNMRQKTYARRFHERMVYTPQMVIQGKTAMVGHREPKVNAALVSARDKQARADLSLQRHGDVLTISVQPTGAPVGETEFHLIRFSPEAVVQIGRGENAGRRLQYTNVVMSWDVIGVWNGANTTEITAPITGDLPAAVLLQERDQGAVLAAAALR